MIIPKNFDLSIFKEPELAQDGRYQFLMEMAHELSRSKEGQDQNLLRCLISFFCRIYNQPKQVFKQKYLGLAFHFVTNHSSTVKRQFQRNQQQEKQEPSVPLAKQTLTRPATAFVGPADMQKQELNDFEEGMRTCHSGFDSPRIRLQHFKRKRLMSLEEAPTAPPASWVDFLDYKQEEYRPNSQQLQLQVRPTSAVHLQPKIKCFSTKLSEVPEGYKSSRSIRLRQQLQLNAKLDSDLAVKEKMRWACNRSKLQKESMRKVSSAKVFHRQQKEPGSAEPGIKLIFKVAPQVKKNDSTVGLEREYSKQRMHKTISSWGKSLAGGFERMDFDNQPSLTDLHHISKRKTRCFSQILSDHGHDEQRLQQLREIEDIRKRTSMNGEALKKGLMMPERGESRFTGKSFTLMSNPFAKKGRKGKKGKKGKKPKAGSHK